MRHIVLHEKLSCCSLPPTVPGASSVLTSIASSSTAQTRTLHPVSSAAKLASICCNKQPLPSATEAHLSNAGAHFWVGHLWLNGDTDCERASRHHDAGPDPQHAQMRVCGAVEGETCVLLSMPERCWVLPWS